MAFFGRRTAESRQSTRRLAVHVGPHKTGTTSVQAACAANRERLARDGVLYPRMPEGEFLDSHADAAFMLRDGRHEAFMDWLMAAWRQAVDAGCPVMLLSSEEFSNDRVQMPLRRALDRFRRATAAETRTIFVQRPVADLMLSNLMQAITGEAGMFFRRDYDVRRWAREFAARARRIETFFSRDGGVTLPLEGFAPEQLAARILAAAADREFPDIVSPRANVAADKFGGQPLMLLSYPLRVMSRVAHGHSIVSPACTAEAIAAIDSLVMNEAVFGRLVEDFTAALRAEIALGIAEAEHAPRPRSWFSRWAAWWRAG